MLARLGEVLYWTGCAIAVVLVGFLLYLEWVEPHSDKKMFIAAFFGIPAAISWLIGRACLYVLAGR